jgi:hypothetical protein
VEREALHMTFLWRVLTAITLTLIPASALAGVKISLRIQGGWANIAGGDVNNGTQAFYDWGKAHFGPMSGGLIEGGFSPLHGGYEIGGDVIFQLTRTFGLGIGMSYLRMSSTNDESMMKIRQNAEDLNPFFVYEATELNAVPIRLGAFFSWPVNDRLDITANGGFSWCLRVRYHADWWISRFDPLDMPPSQHLSTRAETGTLSIGLQGGAGVEYRLLPRIGLFVEAQGRLARSRGLEGMSTSEEGEWGGLFPSFSESGTLYFESVPMLSGEPRLVIVQTAPPPGPGGNARLAAVDLSGVTLRAGIRVRF